jgi:hypothetical protein
MPLQVKENEGRKHRRYRLQLPAVFQWVDDITRTDGGFTRDVSSNALFLSTTTLLPLKTRLRLKLLLPGTGRDPGNAITASGRIIRLAQHNEGSGFVLKVRLYTNIKIRNTATFSLLPERGS